MVNVTITDRTGKIHALTARTGYTLMEIALEADVVGIDADCRGSCACATCHVHVDEAWFEQVGQPNELEGELLSLADNVGPASRLSCQIRLHPDLDGLKVIVP